MSGSEYVHPVVYLADADGHDTIYVFATNSGALSNPDWYRNHAARDWVRHAVEQLSEPLRVVTLLRYFTGVKTYEQIGAVCGIPVGTVRSRLSKARSALARQLHESAAQAHANASASSAAAQAKTSARVRSRRSPRPGTAKP